jgi:hypothetical protein
MSDFASCPVDASWSELHCNLEVAENRNSSLTLGVCQHVMTAFVKVVIVDVQSGSPQYVFELPKK